MKVKKFLALFIIMAVVITCMALLSTEAEAATVASGTCGANLTWVLDDQGTLTISGTGNMTGYGSSLLGTPAPWKEYSSKIKEVIVKAGVTSIGNYAFYFCGSVQKITLPNTITKIGENSFSHCTSLSTIEIPNGVKTIPIYAFNGCNSLEYINIPSTVQSFGQGAFNGCSSLEYFIIPDGVREISSEMFWRCSALEYVQIPASVTKIKTFAFHDCGNLFDVYYSGTKTQFSNISIDYLNEYNEGLTYATIHYSSKAPCRTHTYGNYTKVSNTQHSRTCANCGYIETVSHAWNSGTITKQPSCKETGTKTVTCTGCNAAKTETIAKLTTHTYGSWIKVNDTTHKHVCSVCSKEETANHTWNGGSVTKAATCKETGLNTYTCTACNATKTETVAKLTTHTYNSWTKADDTTHKHTCSICQKEETANHTWNSGAVTKKATCKDTGVKTYTCTTCSSAKTETISKLTTHTYDHACDTSCNICGLTRTTTHSYKTEWSKDKANHWHECSVCKDKQDSANHTPSAAATETKAQTCTTCSYIITPALGHKHSYATTWTTDENGHWYKCSGCEEKGSYADHDFENACDTDCSICGYTRQTQHTFDEQWASDKEQHYHKCTGCGLKQDEAAHEPGAAATDTTAQTCTICGYEIAPATGAEEAKPTTKPTTTTPTQSSKSETPVKDKEGGFPWVIVVVAIIAIGGTAGVILWKKKH